MEPAHNPHHKLLYRTLAATMLLIGCAVFYYLVIFLPRQADLKAQQDKALLQQQQQLEQAKLDQEKQLQQTKLDQEQQQKADQSAALRTCLDTATQQEQDNWTNECAHFGTDNKGPNCLLPTYNSNQVIGYEKNAKDLCIKEYPQ